MTEPAPPPPGLAFAEGERLFRILAHALALAGREGGPIDLLVTEVMLDDINGGELAASLQRERPALRALFVVEDAGEADPRLALPAPEDWLLHRRSPGESLLAKVARALSAGDVAAGRRPGA